MTWAIEKVDATTITKGGWPFCPEKPGSLLSDLVLHRGEAARRYHIDKLLPEMLSKKKKPKT